MKTYIHVNKQVLAQNRKNGTSRPPITAKNYKTNQYGHRVDITTPDGTIVASVVYRPSKPLGCGAVVWIETNLNVHVDVDPASVDTLSAGPVTGECSAASSCPDTLGARGKTPTTAAVRAPRSRSSKHPSGTTPRSCSFKQKKRHVPPANQRSTRPPTPRKHTTLATGG